MGKQIQPTPPESVLSVKKVSTISVAHTILYTTDYWFDNILYPAVLLRFGTLIGLIILIILSGLISFRLLVLHTRSKVDWLGVDVVEVIKANTRAKIEKFYSKKGVWWEILHITTYVFILPLRIVLWALDKNDFAAFVALSIYTDAFKTTAFLRHGRKGKLSRRDYKIFYSSIVLSNLWWTLRWSVIIEFIKWLV